MWVTASGHGRPASAHCSLEEQPLKPQGARHRRWTESTMAASERLPHRNVLSTHLLNEIGVIHFSRLISWFD